MDILFNDIINKYGVSEKEVDLLNPLILAYIGDAVYEVYVRTYLIGTMKVTVHKLHTSSIKFVKAKAQSDIIHYLDDKLTDEEKDIVRRGRNAKSGTIPKNADVTEYKYATGFEALMGYLYLKGRHERLEEIFKLCIMKVLDSNQL